MRKYLPTFLLILGASMAAFLYIVSTNSMIPLSTLNQESPTNPEPLSITSGQSLDSSSSHPDKQLTTTSPTETHRVSDPRALLLYEKGLKLYYQRQFPEALVLFNQALQIDDLCYEALNAKGATLAFQGQHDQGLALIKQALDLNPTFVYANFNLGLAYELAGKWDDSIASYQKALQLDDQDTWSYYGIASIYGRQGNVEKVLVYLEQAIALDPDVKSVARSEHDFSPVQHDTRFQALVKP
ncbi:tetratricopeptide repeat protein [Desulfosporosinus hippei]|uniref:Tetratricopeptide repeat-containing protein n=1 Tax=Desulfosporosinus hippei DSM 8344 TaxID=1121419 RepID=A0A1G7XT78_9FIRM|nr:tetratricopeptide repeat protein [Desulfosporosinus hippei]SDG87398.1 Tetratricopeptide repeat-containing protein [Desulfosporosinus hippei DSM 8344]